MELYPAIDIRGGRCVRLHQGDFDRETVYGDDPLAVARSFARAGARWIHVVDLDAARRTGDNRTVIESIVGRVGVAVEVGGGVQDGTWLERGAARVVLGSLAISDPDCVAVLTARYPARVAVGLDHRDGEVRVHGWQSGSGLGLAEVIARVAVPELAAVVVTAIAADGMLAGPDLAGLAAALELTEVPVIASGGVRDLEDLRALARLRSGGRALAGVIVGKALYEGRLDIPSALEVLA
jgi:phosphoribosylformimino-5-aminoimidazole carboxamide ribotide isomerase